MKAITQAEVAKKRLVDAIMRGDIADEDVSEQMADVNSTIERLNATLAVSAVPARPITPVLIRDLKTDWPTLPVSTARSRRGIPKVYKLLTEFQAHDTSVARH